MDEQLPVLPGFEDMAEASLFLEKSGPGMGEYSGDLIKARNPQLYSAVVQLLGRGYGIRDTAAILSMSARSVMAIRDREPQSIATVKESTAKRYMDVATLAAEVARDRLLQDPDKIAFKDLMIGAGVATDKHLVLSGEATQRVEHVVRNTEEDFTRMLEDARQRGQVIEGEVVDTDITPPRPAPKGPQPPGAQAPAGGADEPADGPREGVTSDVESGVSCVNPQLNRGNQRNATGSDSADGAAVAFADGPRPGDRGAEGEGEEGRGGGGRRPADFNFNE